ncbi:hypothetical protein [Haladaptatus sp. CMAA 1911]|uniref:hypothetical protein n=1 Tax=unclassified Haladaptatus TaxID=2622732 RepID=UPI003754C12E
MELFELERSNFRDRFDFNEYLSNHYSDLSSRNLYIISGITSLDQSGFEQRLADHRFTVKEEYGAVKKVENQYGSSDDSIAEAYLTFDSDHGLFFLYTNQRKTIEIEGGIEPFFSAAPDVHYLYLSPHVLSNARERIVEAEPSAKVTEFIAKRTKRTDMPTATNVSSDMSRTVNYYADDGLQQLRRWENELGVLPHIMQFDIPSALKFRITKEGIFTLKSGSLTVLFEYVGDCIRESLRIADAYRDSDFEMLRMSDSFTLPSATPAVISLQNELEYHEIDGFISELENDNYIVLNQYDEEGSLFFSGKVYDDEHNLFFDLRANQDEIRVFPREEQDIGSFYHLFEFIQDYIDDRANIEQLEA